ncbi:hypothetical protein Tco_1476231 [Tanacetum coccineum]
MKKASQDMLYELGEVIQFIPITIFLQQVKTKRIQVELLGTLSIHRFTTQRATTFSTGTLIGEDYSRNLGASGRPLCGCLGLSLVDSLVLVMAYKTRHRPRHIFTCSQIGSLNRVSDVRTRDHEDHHDDDARHEGESSAKRQNTSEHGTFTIGESSSSQAMNESSPSSLGTQEQLEDFDAWKDDQGIDDDESYMESQIVWESREEDLTEHIPKKPALVFLSCVRNLKIPPMSLVNQDLFYLKNGNSVAKKYLPSLHKIHAFSFLENDFEELNTRWVKRLSIGLISMQDILLIIRKAHGLNLESYQQKVNLTTPTITFPGVEEQKLLTITFDPIVGLIYENSKKENRVMDIKEIPKFCDATLKRVLDKAKKVNLDIKHGYADPDLSREDAEYMMFHEEYIQDRLRHRNQMRRW